jgi:hypothetical protein
MKTFLSRKVALAGLAVALVSGEAKSETIRTVDASRIVVGDLVEGSEYGDLELGPAPPPGGSRLVERREVLDAIRQSGGTVSQVKMPSTVRVVRASRRLDTRALEAMAEPLLIKALPGGVTIHAFHALHTLVVSPSATLRKSPMSKLPRRAGEVRTTVMFEFVSDGEVEARLPVAVTLNLDERAAQADVVRGARIDLVIERGPAKVTASGFAMSDGDVGDVISVRVDSTQKILEARLESSASARVVKP